MSFIKSKSLQNRLERIYLFANNDFNSRYYGAKLGILWAFLNPFFQILVYYVAFTYLIYRKNNPSFILYLFTGIITWQFFSETTNSAISIFQKQRYILQNMNLPKVDFFYSLIGSKLWGYIINILIFFAFDLLFFNPNFSSKLFFLLPIFLGLTMFSLGISFFLGTLFIYFRDLNHVWSIVLMAGFWLVPVVWDYKIVYTTYPLFLYFPITAFVVNLRQVILENQTPDIHYMIVSLVVSFLIAIAGYFFMQYRSKRALEFL